MNENFKFRNQVNNTLGNTCSLYICPPFLFVCFGNETFSFLSFQIIEKICFKMPYGSFSKCDFMKNKFPDLKCVNMFQIIITFFIEE
jgi:hypothetical protein